MTQIPIETAIRASMSGVDRQGLLFEHDRRLFRAFRGEDARALAQLLEDRGLQDLFDAGLVEFWPADVTVASFDLVVEVRRVARVSYPTEWPTLMVKEAAVMLADLAAQLARRGIGIKDPHPWNILFDGPRPVFVDLGSLVTDPTPSVGWRREYLQHLMLPLSAHALGLHRLGDRILQEHPIGTVKSIASGPVGRRLLGWRLEHMFHTADGPAEFYEHLASRCDSMDVSGTTMAWSAYDQQEVPVGTEAQYSPKQRAVADVLRRFEPTTLLDVACNQGWYSELAASMGFEVVGTDIDDAALGVAFRRAREGDLSVLPLRTDLVWPRGSYGMALTYAGPYSRLRSDIVLVLALVHHLARNHDLSFTAFAQLIDRLAISAAVVEFIPRDDVHVARWGLGDWYTEEGFVRAMQAFFSHVTRLPSSPTPRSLYLFER